MTLVAGGPGEKISKPVQTFGASMSMSSKLSLGIVIMCMVVSLYGLTIPIFKWGATKRRPVLIFSDIDDTIYPGYSRLTGSIGGTDQSYSHKTIYPGFSTFFYELTRLYNPNVPDELLPVPLLLSARPSIFGGIPYIRQRLVEASGNLQWGINFTINVNVDLYGNVGDFFSQDITDRFKEYAQTKVTNLESALLSKEIEPQGKGEEQGNEHAGVDQEANAMKRTGVSNFDFIFVGDNGQGDAYCMQLLQSSQLNSRFLAGLVHQVTETPVLSTKESPKIINYKNVVDLVELINKNRRMLTFSTVQVKRIHSAFLREHEEIMNHNPLLKHDLITHALLKYDRSCYGM